MSDRTRVRERALTRLRRNWRRMLLASMLLVLVVVVFLLPTIIANSPAKNTVLGQVNEQLDGTLQAGAVQLGWFSPVVIHDLQLLDANDREVATVDSVSISATLLGLLFDSSDLGQVTINKAVVDLKVRPGGDNLSDVLQPLLSADSEPSDSIYVLQIVDARVNLSDSQGRELGAVMASGEAQWDAGDSQAAWKLKGETSPDKKSGAFASDGRLALAAEDGSTASNGSLTWSGDGAQLSIIDAIGIRIGTPLAARGRISGAGKVEWGATGSLVSVERLRVDGLDVSGLPGLQGDRLRSSVATAKGGLFIEQGELRCRDLELETDWARLAASIDLDLDVLQTLVQSNERHDLADAARGEIRGAVDLAALSRALPNTIHLRRDVQIHEGSVNFHILNSSLNDGRRIEAHVETRPLTATTQAGEVQWRDPLRLDVVAKLREDGWDIERATCRSEFLTLEGSGPPNQGQFNVSGDLDQLRTRLARFVDLGGLQFGGQLKGNGHWRRRPEGVDIGGEVKIERFSLAAGANIWREPLIQASASAVVPLARKVANDWTPQSWRAELVVGREVLAIQPEADGYRMALQGDFQRWSKMANTFGLSLPVQVSGRLSSETVASFTSKGLTVRKSHWDIEQLRVDGVGLQIVEPQIEINTSGEWDATTRTWRTKQLRIHSQTATVASDELVVALLDAPHVDGIVSLRGDLTRLQRWAPTAYDGDLYGQFVAAAKVTLADNVLQTSWEVNVEKFALATPTEGRRLQPVSRSANIVWEEPTAKFAGSARYGFTDRNLNFGKSTVTTDWLSLGVEGNVNLSDADPAIDVRGEVTYDWPTAMKRLRLDRDDKIKLYGRDTHSFFVRGPLSAASVDVKRRTSDATAASLVSGNLAGEGSLSWRQAEVWGFQLGRTKLNGRLRNQVVRFEPILTTMNDGDLKLTPTVDLRTREPVLSLAKSDGLSRVRLTPEMCHGWLKYIAPSVANATVAEGELSVGVDKFATPILDTNRMTMAGRLDIHQARVGPGQVTRELIQSLQQLLAIVDPAAAEDLSRPTWVNIPAQEVEFRVTEGRVYHDRMVLRIRDADVVTSGSVGLDQSLDLLVQVPVLDRWVESNRFLAGLRGKTIPFRFRGSFAKPNVDESALRDLGRDGIKGAAEQLLQDQLERGLRGLFK